MRVLICGSRDWTRSEPIEAFLYGLLHQYNDLEVVDGHARGADKIACDWANEWLMSDKHHCFPADWDKYGNGAGPIRNQQMLDEAKPDIVVAFKNNFDKFFQKGGTEDMCNRAKHAGINVFLFEELEYKTKDKPKKVKK